MFADSAETVFELRSCVNLNWCGLDILGTPAVTGRAGTVTGAGLGGRRAQVALALEPSGVTSDRLAEMIWAGDRPATWQAALRGVIRGLRTALRDSAGDQVVILTEPGGYRIAPGIEVDLLAAEEAVGAAAELNCRGRHRAALDAAGPVARIAGRQLLAGEVSQQLTQVAHDVRGAVIPAAGHNIALENPAALAKAYLDFFAGS